MRRHTHLARLDSPRAGTFERGTARAAGSTAESSRARLMTARQRQQTVSNR